MLCIILQPHSGGVSRGGLHFVFRFSFLEEPLEFLVPLGDIDIMETQTATFMCEVSKPAQTASWYKGERELKADKRIEMLVEESKHFLIIKESITKDEADYTIKIKDKSSTGTLFVEGQNRFFSRLHNCHDNVYNVIHLSIVNFSRKHIFNLEDASSFTEHRYMKPIISLTINQLWNIYIFIQCPPSLNC